MAVRHKKVQLIKTFQGPTVSNFKSYCIVGGYWEREAEGSRPREVAEKRVMRGWGRECGHTVCCSPRVAEHFKDFIFK